MNIKSLLAYLWKLPLCSLAFIVAMIVSGIVLPLVGFESPALPDGADANTILLWFLLGSLLLALALSFLSRNLPGGFLFRWLALGFLTWATSAVSMVLEAYFFMTTGAVSSGGAALFTIFNFLLPGFAIATMAALLFPPEHKGEGWRVNVRAHFASRTASEWAWRVAVAIVAFPVIYLTFGEIVQPFIKDYYTTGAYELAAPTWAQIIPLQLARSLLFLLVCLPVVATWRKSSGQLNLTLGFALFALVGFMSVITSYWFPWQLRLYHGLEILADSLVYAAVLAVLLARPETRTTTLAAVAQAK